MSDRADAVVHLTELAVELDEKIGEYIGEWPSARISHARPSYLVSALRRELDTVDKDAEREARIAANAADREERITYTPFEIEMAKLRKARGYEGGHTPAEYRALVEAAQANMAPQSPEEVAKIMREAG